LRDRLVRHVPAAAHEVATRPQVPTPELRPQSAAVLEEMMGRLPLDRLHDPTRRDMRWHAQQQMDVFGPHVPLENFDVLRSADLPNQLTKIPPHFTAEHRLAILRDEHEVVVQTINRVGSSTILPHVAASYRKPPEGVAGRRGNSPIPERDLKRIPDLVTRYLLRRDTFRYWGE